MQGVQDRVEIRGEYDIRRAVAEFVGIKTANTIVSAEITAGTNKPPQKVTAPAECDYKSLILKGFETVRKRLEILKRVGDSAKKVVSVDGHMWLDDLIERKFGGKRDGLRIRWDIPDGTFYFDPFSCKLTKANHAS